MSASRSTFLRCSSTAAAQRNHPSRACRQRPRSGRLEVEITESIFLEGGDATLAAAALVALARRPRRARRFRHRLFVAELSAELPVRQIEDRPQLHPEPADPRRRERHRPRDHRARPCAQHRNDGRRRRRNCATDGAARPRLLVGPGLSLRRADDCERRRPAVPRRASGRFRTSPDCRSARGSSCRSDRRSCSR